MKPATPPEIIDWRNEPDRVIDILGPQIILPEDAKTPARAELEDLARQSCFNVRLNEENYIEKYTAAAAAWIRYTVEASRYSDTMARPITVRLGMDANHALPANSAIAFKPYILIQGFGRYVACKSVGFHNFEPVLHENRTSPLPPLYAIKKRSKRAGYSYTGSNLLELSDIADAIDDITWEVKEGLQGTYNVENGMRAAYRHPANGIVAVDGDYKISRLAMARNYSNFWNSGNNFPKPR